MLNIKVEQLSLENFNEFGSYTNLLQSDSEHIGEMPIIFYRDIINGVLETNHLSVSMVECEKREMLIDEAEQHLNTCEFLLPLDDDVIVFASPASKKVEVNKIRAFFVPQGTMVTFNAGVWHKAPFPMKKEVAHSLVLLPPLTYLKDCIVEKIDQIVLIQM